MSRCALVQVRTLASVSTACSESPCFHLGALLESEPAPVHCKSLEDLAVETFLLEPACGLPRLVPKHPDKHPRGRV